MKKAVLLHGTDGSPNDHWFPWRKISLISGIVLLAIATVLFVSRGWIRTSFIPNVVAGPVEKSLLASYNDAYASSRAAMQTLEMDLVEAYPKDCSMFSAEKLSTTVSCSARSSGKKLYTSEYVTLFKERALSAEQSLLENGWIKYKNRNQPINELFDRPDNDYSVTVGYLKYYKDMDCRISIFFNAWENPKAMYNRLSCQVFVDYFFIFKK